jgi:hypothetical protein
MPGCSLIAYRAAMLAAMKNQQKERWQELCEQAITEQDQKKMLELATEINKLLDEKFDRLAGKTPDKLRQLRNMLFLGRPNR